MKYDFLIVGAGLYGATFAEQAKAGGKTVLGHSSLKMTMDLYAHVLPNTKQEEMQKLEIVV